MDLAKKLAIGVGSWLQYQHACNNSGLFSEQYLSEPIGRVLSSLTTERVIAEYPHPILGPLATGPGRRPSIDFVICDPYPNVKVAVESKWIGVSKPTPQSIIWDLIRLELIANDNGADCFFLLGGMKRSLDAYFKNVKFAGPKSTTKHKPILHAYKNAMFPVDLSASVQHRIPFMKKLFAPYQEMPFPHKIVSRRANPFPMDCKSDQYQIYVWRISSKSKRGVFYPKNSKHYSD